MSNKFILFFLFVFSCSCSSSAQKQSSIFSFKEYQEINKPISKRDSSILFINLLHEKKFSEAEKIYPKLFKLNVEPGIIRVDGEEPFLNGLGDYLDEYSTNSYDFLVLTEFLRKKYNTRIEFYDKMIRGSLGLDSTNVPAMFLLAKLRFENGIDQDAQYLVNHLVKLEPNNKKIQEVNKYFKTHKNPLTQDSPSLYSFLRLDIIFKEKE